MAKISRRRFLSTAACSVAAARLSAQSRQEIQVALSIPSQATGPSIPEDFVGLSYEVQQLTNPSFFSAQNSGLIGAFKQLAPHGVLRLGGNTGEFAWWKPSADSPEPAHPPTREVVGEPKALYYPVTPEAIRNLGEFLEATGWTCIYGLNMGTNTPGRAADEAAFAAATLGARLQYFQIGNEPDLFDRHLRDAKSWSAKAYLDEWLVLARAIQARVPSARFGLPDAASNVSWLEQVAGMWAAIPDPPRLAALSHHYYFGGPATNPDVNIQNLLAPAAMVKVQQIADEATSAAAKLHLRVRMTEGNTCYRGGKPGVSDVFAAALWAADYALLLALNNYTGINLHGGTGMSVANGLGGFLPGDVMLAAQGATPAQIAARPHPFYTPIATFGTEYVLEPVAYGLKFAGTLAGGTIVDGGFTQKLQAAGINASAYAARLQNGTTVLAILNKDSGNSLTLRLDFGAGRSDWVDTKVLQGLGLEGRQVPNAPSPIPLRLQDGKFQGHVPPASAVLYRVG